MAHFIKYMFLLMVMLSLYSCTNKSKSPAIDTKTDTTELQNDLIQTMQKHLDAVTNKDLESLESTLSPEGKMMLILPQSEITYTTDDFIEYHREWFKDTTWSFKTKIITTKVSNTLGMAITEIVYSEPNRDGKPYFNRMHVSYVLERINDKWYVIKDHASSIEKSTDKQ